MEVTNNSDVRMNNRKRLVNLLFLQGQMTKQELVARLNISLATVNYLVKELMEQGLLTTGKAMDSTGGRKPVCIMPVYDAKFSIGAEAARDYVRVVILDLGSNIVAKESHAIRQENTIEYWSKVSQIIRDIRERHGILKEQLLDVGITLGMTMQDECMVTRKEQNREAVIDLEIARQGLGMPVHFRNSTKMAAVAHYWHGAEQNHFVFLYLGTKVSGAYVHEGKVLDFAGINGELGCMIQRSDAKELRVDQIFSKDAICKAAKVQKAEEFFEKLKQQEPKCQQIWVYYLEQLGLFLHNLYCMFGWKIVLGGSLSPYLEDSLGQLEEIIQNRYPFEKLPKGILSVSNLQEYGAAAGAAMLPVDKYLEFGYGENS